MNAQANSAKHSAFIRNTGYTPRNGAIPSATAISAVPISTRLPESRDAAAVSLTAIGHRSFPNNPAGRISSTMTMITKITVFDASG